MQDPSAMATVHAARIERGMKILDSCSAPGGKAVHAANLLEVLGGGNVIARDLTEKKTALIIKAQRVLKRKNFLLEHIKIWY